MEKRSLGKTGFNVSVIGFGGIPIQRVDRQEAVRLLEEASKQGINFIDTARGYRNSEELLGHALEEVGRDKFILATKSMDRTYEGIIKELEESLKNLRTDYIDLFQFHNVRTEEDYELLMSSRGGLRAIKEYQKKGIVKEIGITSHSREILDIAMDTDEFATIQYPYNPVERQGEFLFEKARKKNIGVIVMKPLAGGAIPKGELCLRFIMENENVTVAIPGMENIGQVRENAGVGQDIRRLTDSEKEELKEEVDRLGPSFCRRCGYCSPCSVGIDIPSQFIMEGYYLRYNLGDWAKERYDGMEVKAKDCIACGDCEPRCPYDLPIIEMLERVEENLG